MDPTSYLQRFLDLGVPIDARNDRGETPLFEYVASGDINSYEKYLSLFTEAGADIQARNNEGQTPLHVLAPREPMCMRMPEGEEEPQVGYFRYLMEKGVDPTVEDRRQRTAVDVAAAKWNGGILGMFQRKK